jgi:hypothetical protein
LPPEREWTKYIRNIETLGVHETYLRTVSNDNLNMKKASVLFTAVLLMFTFLSCEDLTCDGKGTLSVENSSISTTQRLMVDGVNYGSVDPGKTKEVDLAPGQHIWQLVALAGGTGCSAATVIIEKCETSSYKCSGK